MSKEKPKKSKFNLKERIKSKFDKKTKLETDLDPETELTLDEDPAVDLTAKEVAEPIKASEKETDATTKKKKRKLAKKQGTKTATDLKNQEEKQAAAEKEEEVKPLIIVPYRGYGRRNFISCKGRILVDKPIESTANDSRWQNIKNTYRRFDSDEMPNAVLQANYHDYNFVLTTDHEGYYHLKQEFLAPINTSNAPTNSWHTINLELQEAPIPFEKPVRVQGEILVPPTTAAFGVISDLDDTLIITEVTSTVKMIYNSFTKNAYTRPAFTGAPAWYKAFNKGSNGQQNNPLFYVSNGPWNLYDMLTEFMEINNIPKGPILLRDFGRHKGEHLVNYKTHKRQEILNILYTYPKLKFVLIGDSGEKDADIYLSVAQAFPKRIRAIYIRKVNDKKRNERIQQLMDKVDDVETLLFNDSLEAAKHAKDLGLIDAEGLDKVVQSMNKPVPDTSEIIDEEKE